MDENSGVNMIKSVSLKSAAICRLILNSSLSPNVLKMLHNNESPFLERHNNRKGIKHDPFATDSSLCASATANTDTACSKHEKLSQDSSCIHEASRKRPISTDSSTDAFS